MYLVAAVMFGLFNVVIIYHIDGKIKDTSHNPHINLTIGNRGGIDNHYELEYLNTKGGNYHSTITYLSHGLIYDCQYVKRDQGMSIKFVKKRWTGETSAIGLRHNLDDDNVTI